MIVAIVDSVLDLLICQVQHFLQKLSTLRLLHAIVLETVNQFRPLFFRLNSRIIKRQLTSTLPLDIVHSNSVISMKIQHVLALQQQNSGPTRSPLFHIQSVI